MSVSASIESPARPRLSGGLRWLWRYGFAVFAVVLATATRYWLGMFFGDSFSFITFAPVLILVAILAGLGPGLLATLLSGVAVDYLFPGSAGSSAVAGQGERIAFAVFLGTGVAVCLLGERIRQSTAELRSSKAHLDRAQAVAQIGSWDLDIAKDVLTWSDETYRLFQVPLGTPLCLEKFLERVYPGDRQRVLEAWNAALKGAPYDIEHRVLIEGEARWVRERAEVEFETEGKPRFATGTVQDVTDRKHFEEALAGSRRRLETVLDNLPMMVCLLTPAFDVPFANRAFRKQFGESQGRRCFEYCFGRSAPCELCETFQVLQTNAPHEWEFTTPDGRLIHAYDLPFTDTDGSPLVLGVSVDITDQRQAQEKSREASLYARSLLEASLDPLVTINREGKITDVNEATEEVTGVSRRQIIGSDFSDYFTEPEKARQGYETVFAKGSVKDYPLVIRHVSGKLTDVLYNATVFRNHAGEVQGVFAAARDVTERNRVQAELELSRAQSFSSARLSALGMMAGGIAHEINNPLAVIHASASDLVEMAGTGNLSLNELQTASARIKQTADRISKIVKSLRQIAREGRADPFQWASVGDIVEQALELCRERFRVHSVLLHTVLPDPELRVFCREV